MANGSSKTDGLTFQPYVPPNLKKRILAMTKEERENLARLATPRIVSPYFVHIPHPKQQLFLSLQNREAMYGGAAGGGKKSNVDSHALTPNGWKRMGDLEVGDALVNPRNGKQMHVLLAHPVTREQVWEVEFDDGAVLEVHEEHLWTIRAQDDVPMHWNKDAHSYEDHWLTAYNTTTTRQLKSLVDRAKRLHGVNWLQYPHTPVARAAVDVGGKGRGQTNIQRPIPPYLMGVLVSGSCVILTTGIQLYVDNPYALRKFKEHMQGFYPEAVVEAYPWDINKPEGKAVVVNITNCKALANGLTALGWTNYRDPFIPAAYMSNTGSAFRKSLMCGLMDNLSAADKQNGALIYMTPYELLAKDVQDIARSLGAHVKLTVIKRDNTGLLDSMFELTITAHDVQNFLTDRDKQERVKFNAKEPVRRVIDVRQTERTVDMRCITVDTTDGLYIQDDYIVTHNSDALLLAAAQYVDVPGYSALLLRRTWPDLNSPGAILDRARSWWNGMEVRQRDGGRIFEFPSGARIQFGYIQHDKDKYKYQSSEYQFVGFDELTQFSQNAYLYLFSRIRRPQVSCLNCREALKRNGTSWQHANKGNRCDEVFADPKILEQYPANTDGISVFDVPLRMRSASNPGGIGHEWVRDRFVDPKTRERAAIFVPASLRDNPSLDKDSYAENLKHLNGVDRDRLLGGDWDVVERGDIFDPSWFNYVDRGNFGGRSLRYWDRAATENGGDYTVGTLVTLTDDGRWIIEDVVRGQWSSAQSHKIIAATAARDGLNVPIRMEQEPGSAGKDVIDMYARTVLPGYAFKGIRSTGSKEDRAGPLSAAAELGNVYVVKARWNREWANEFATFPVGANDDQVDSAAGAVNQLSFARRTRLLV